MMTCHYWPSCGLVHMVPNISDKRAIVGCDVWADCIALERIRPHKFCYVGCIRFPHRQLINQCFFATYWTEMENKPEIRCCRNKSPRLLHVDTETKLKPFQNV